jgi:hypothetical protein
VEKSGGVRFSPFSSNETNSLDKFRSLYSIVQEELFIRKTVSTVYGKEDPFYENFQAALEILKDSIPKSVKERPNKCRVADIVDFTSSVLELHQNKSFSTKEKSDMDGSIDIAQKLIGNVFTNL